MKKTGLEARVKDKILSINGNREFELDRSFYDAKRDVSKNNEEVLELRYQGIDAESVYAEGGDIETFLVDEGLPEIEVSPLYEEDVQTVAIVGDFDATVYDPKSAGRAYAFFNCDASREEIESTMSDVRQYTSTPDDLELRLYEGTSELELDDNLAELIKLPGDYRRMTEEQKSRWDGQREEMLLSELQYVLVADYPNATNRKTACELGYVMDYIFKLNEDRSGDKGAVFCEEDGGYIFRV